MGNVLVNNVSGNKVTETLEFQLEKCSECGISFFMPVYFMKQRRSDGGRFYCLNGHTLYYTVGETEEQKKIKQLEQELNAERKSYDYLLNDYSEEKKKAIKLKRDLNRVHKGVCQCCNRTFQNLQKHMETKHHEKLKV